MNIVLLSTGRLHLPFPLCTCIKPWGHGVHVHAQGSGTRPRRGASTALGSKGLCVCLFGILRDGFSV